MKIVRMTLVAHATGGLPPYAAIWGKEAGSSSERLGTTASRHAYRVACSSRHVRSGLPRDDTVMFASRRLDAAALRADSARRLDAMRTRAACCRIDSGLL